MSYAPSGIPTGMKLQLAIDKAVANKDVRTLQLLASNGSPQAAAAVKNMLQNNAMQQRVAALGQQSSDTLTPPSQQASLAPEPAMAKGGTVKRRFDDGGVTGDIPGLDAGTPYSDAVAPYAPALEQADVAVDPNAQEDADGYLPGEGIGQRALRRIKSGLEAIGRVKKYTNPTKEELAQSWAEDKAKKAQAAEKPAGVTTGLRAALDAKLKAQLATDMRDANIAANAKAVAAVKAPVPTTPRRSPGIAAAADEAPVAPPPATAVAPDTPNVADEKEAQATHSRLMKEMDDLTDTQIGANTAARDAKVANIKGKDNFWSKLAEWGSAVVSAPSTGHTALDIGRGTAAYMQLQKTKEAAVADVMATAEVKANALQAAKLAAKIGDTDKFHTAMQAARAADTDIEVKKAHIDYYGKMGDAAGDRADAAGVRADAAAYKATHPTVRGGTTGSKPMSDYQASQLRMRITSELAKRGVPEAQIPAMAETEFARIAGKGSTIPGNAVPGANTGVKFLGFE